MHERGELSLIGDRVVPVQPWIQEVFARLEGEAVACIVCDQFKQALLGEGLAQAGITVPVIFRRFGWYHGGEDVTRFRNCVLDKRVKVKPSLLLRSAVGDCVVQKDDCGNERLAKGRSSGRIDAIAASVVAIAEGDRRSALPEARAPRVAWA
jgi:phage terminase large subunit-like protein